MNSVKTEIENLVVSSEKHSWLFNIKSDEVGNEKRNHRNQNPCLFRRASPEMDQWRFVVNPCLSSGLNGGKTKISSVVRR